MGRPTRKNKTTINKKQQTEQNAAGSPADERGSTLLAPRAPAAACHIHSLEDGIADLQVAGAEPSIADVDAYLDVWLFIVTASSIFDDCNFVVPTMAPWNS